MAYETINHANIYYSLNGYQNINSPWLIDGSVSDITKPDDKQNFYINHRVLVASDEQSFLQLILDKQLTPQKRFQTTTPCFRDDIDDELHKQYFLKTELIYFEYIDNTPEQDDRLFNEFDKMINVCKKFYQKYLPVKCIDFEDASPDHFSLKDIISSDNQIELGSYGIRKYRDVIWIYGTGCAEPRLSHCVNQLNKPGYHISLIPKASDIASIEKIIEEYDEFIDAIKQGSNIMALVELADLVGAIDLYIKKNFNMSFNDLKIFSDITQRAFINGRRS